MLEKIVQMLISSGIALAVLSAIGLIFKEAVVGYLSRRLDENFANRTAEFESKLRINENELRELQRLTNSLTEARNKYLDQRKIDANEFLWEEICQNNINKLSAEFLKSFNIEEINKGITSGKASQENLSTFIEEISKLAGIDKLAERRSDREKLPNWVKLHVSDEVWAVYEAHSAIISHGITTFITWKSGLSTKIFLKNDETIKLALKALPHQKDFLAKYGIGGCYFLLDELQSKAFIRLQNDIKFQ